ncbi:hypothetical protein DOY81_008469 [Sarcophaga bullata]|nr:hypothetical protein DOY81_008469 [Sarcophaga bullata]
MITNSFKNICIYRNRHEDIFTRNTNENLTELQVAQEAKFALSHEDSEFFLLLRSPEVETLKIVSEMEHEYDQFAGYNIPPMNFKIFTNLRTLILLETIVSNEDLQVLSQNCLHLETLHVIKCFCEHMHALVPGITLNVKLFQEMSRLKELKIEPLKPPGTESVLKLKELQQLMGNHMKLNCLWLKDYIIDCNDEHVDLEDIPDNLWDLEELNIGIITKDFWCQFTNYLKFCPHLKDLTIHLNDCTIIINVKIIDILRKYCKNLTVLSLINCQINLECFCDLKGLLELTLIRCSGLTYANLQQILGGLHLKSFKLVDTHVSEVNNHIYISDTLESMTIDCIRFADLSEIFQRSLNNFDHLMSLKWLKGFVNHNWLTEKCPRLQYLHMPNPYYLAPKIEDMKHLQELTISSCNGLTWRLLNRIIKRSSLKRLHLITQYFMVDKKRIPEKAFYVYTTLELITMPYEMFLLAFRHWMDLLSLNNNLGLIVYGKATDILSAKLLLVLLKEECIQLRWHKVKICGFSLELEKFARKTILREFAKLHINTNHYRALNKLFTLEL